MLPPAYTRNDPTQSIYCQCLTVITVMYVPISTQPLSFNAAVLTFMKTSMNCTFVVNATLYYITSQFLTAAAIYQLPMMSTSTVPLQQQNPQHT